MIKLFSYYLTILLFFLMNNSIFTGSIQAIPAYTTVSQKNPSEKHLLLNGRIWMDQYSKVEGDQYFLTDIFIKGSVTFNGRKFDNLDLKYDLINDELILKPESHPIIFMNKEMVDSFTLVFEDRNYKIINSGNATSGLLKGYINVLYEGTSKLYVKYSKKIYPLAVDGKYDLFVQEHRIYLQKDSEICPVGGKTKFLKLLDDKKKEISHYLKSNRIKLTGKDANTFVPVLEFYDSIKK